jgi:redox-sensing transcriptional repressor
VQIRKDISSFGRVGRPRIGYRCIELKNILEDFILKDNVVYAVLFGAGNLGKAIMKFPGFQSQRIRLIAAFDKAKNKIGKEINSIKIYPLRQARAIVNRTGAKIGVLAVPPEKSQEVANLMADVGLRGIINFSPNSINVPDGVVVKDIDFSIEILSLFCDLRYNSKLTQKVGG